MLRKCNIIKTINPAQMHAGLIIKVKNGVNIALDFECGAAGYGELWLLANYLSVLQILILIVDFLIKENFSV